MLTPIEQERSWETPARQQNRENLLKWVLLVMAVGIVVMLALVATSHGEERFTPVQIDSHPASPHLQTRRLASDPFVGDANQVHNSLSQHRSWFARHPHIMGAIAIGAAAGAGAGIALSQRRGICQGVYEGQSYYGTAPCPVGTIGAHRR